LPSGLSNPDNTNFADVCRQSSMSTELKDFLSTKGLSVVFFFFSSKCG